MEIVFLIISNSIYFMEFQNQKKQHECLPLRNFKVHNTEFTDVCAQLVTINGKIYAGLPGKSYYDDKINPRLKSILRPIEAWTTFVTQAIPTLDKAIKEQHSTHPPPAAAGTPNGRKGPYSNDMLTLTFLTLLHTFLTLTHTFLNSFSFSDFRLFKVTIYFSL